jgi:hypothetical protein
MAQKGDGINVSEKLLPTFQSRRYSAIMIEAARFPVASVHILQSAWRHMPEDGYFHIPKFVANKEFCIMK